MNIVYALSGEGRGHGSLARAVLPILQQAGHTLHVVTYGQSLAAMAPYNPIEICGIRHAYNRVGRLSPFRTILQNAGILYYYAAEWKTLRRQLAGLSPDLVITNMEPLIPRVARSLGVPVVSFDNQHALVLLPGQIPRGFRLSARVTRTAVNAVAPRADFFVVMSFVSARPRRDNVRVVPPALQPEFRQIRPETGDHVFVYLKQPNPRLLDILRQIDEHFVIYGYNLSAAAGNLTFREFNDRMPVELAASKAIVGTTGLSLLSEAVWLKKPFFGVPLMNEFEQTANAFFIRARSFGDFSERPRREQICSFLQRLDEYRAALGEYHFDPDTAGRTLLDVANRLAA
ncbi:MAG TPA: glycosyltransferase family protein [Verrucomicrobiae bacterium]|nr:glycosyltransferase family protein [Verrucomicrobiae bacterium]